MNTSEASELYEAQAAIFTELAKIAWERSACYAAPHMSQYVLETLRSREQRALSEMDRITKAMLALARSARSHNPATPKSAVSP